MNTTFTRCLLFTVTFLLCPDVSWCRPQKSVIDVGTRSQLFLDRELVYEADGVSFTMHPADKSAANPVLIADQPCEGGKVNQGGTVMFDADEKIFKMWYLGSPSEYFDRIVTFYATSKDGIHWDKSHPGTIKSNNGHPHNAVADGIGPCVMKDLREKDATRRYKMVYYDVDLGYCSMVSPDGIHWQGVSETILPISYVDDVITACWSESHQVFLVFAKQVMPVMGRRRRALWTATSHDFTHWSRAVPALVSDRRDDLGSRIRAAKVRPLLNFPDNTNVMRTEFYGASGYSAESCLVAFPWVFTPTANVPGNQEGPMEVQLAVSRDLVHFDRPFRTPAIENGEPGTWDAGMVSSYCYAFDYQDQVWLYYWATGVTHGFPGPAEGADPGQIKSEGGIGLARWPKDRFVSADGPAGGATLTTMPIRFEGNRLELNASVKPGGKISVELLDMALNRLAAWPLSGPVTGDNLRHVVGFESQADLSTLAGKPVVLRFHLANAELYAFAFRK